MFAYVSTAQILNSIEFLSKNHDIPHSNIVESLIPEYYVGAVVIVVVCLFICLFVRLFSDP